MTNRLNIFLNKKILVYGLGKSGYSAFKFLKNKNDVSLFDDFNLKIKDNYIKNKIISHKKILTTKFDLIILSPGIDINKCKLSKFLKKNIKKIYSLKSERSLFCASNFILSLIFSKLTNFSKNSFDFCFSFFAK